jgi:hypothetical protein
MSSTQPQLMSAQDELTPRVLTVDHPRQLVERLARPHRRWSNLVEDAGDGGTLASRTAQASSSRSVSARVNEPPMATDRRIPSTSTGIIDGGC